MTVPRALLVIIMMVAVGLAIVLVRGESAKTASRVQKLHHRETTLQHQRWAREMDLARLRGPDEIRRRTSELGLDLISPQVRPAGATDRADVPNAADIPVD